MRKLQSLAIVVSIAVSMALLVCLFLLYGGLNKGIKLAEERSGAQGMVVSTEMLDYFDEEDVLFTAMPLPLYFSQEIVDQVEALDGVARVTPQFYGQSLAESCCSTGTETRIIGFDPSTDWIVSACTSYDVSQGLAEDEVIVGAKATGASNGTITIFGKQRKVVAVLDDTGTDLDLSILMDIDVIRADMKEQPIFDYLWKKYGEQNSLVSAIMFDYREGANHQFVNAAIEHLGDYTAIERSALVDESANQLSSLFMALGIVAIALVVLSAIQLMARFFTMVLDRRNELALYRALGATPHNVRILIGGEAFFLTLVGVVVGIPVGLVFQVLELDYLQAQSAFPFVALDAGSSVLGIVVLAAVFFLLTALSVAYPLAKSGRIDPATAMQQADIG